VVAKFTVEQAASAMAVHQLIHDWAYELDQHDGLQMAPLLTEDCIYNVGGEPRHGKAAVNQFYVDRRARLEATDNGPPVMRHPITTLRVMPTGADSADVTFNIVFFMGFGTPPITNMTGPAAVADVTMAVRRDPDGEWRIARFDSWQPFRAG
jgi:ketosteroid isomerase-like protein